MVIGYRPKLRLAPKRVKKSALARFVDTMKQEKFCQNIIKGMTNIDSYMDAYNSKSKTAANVESTKLLARDDIAERIKELQKPIITLLQSQSVSVRQQQIDYILERRKLCEERQDEQSIIRYNEQLNRIYGLYAETVQEEKRESLVNKLDKDTLKKLAQMA